MKTQVKRWGDSKVIVLTPEVLRFYNLKEGDWVDISDIVKVKVKKEDGDELIKIFSKELPE